MGLYFHSRFPISRRQITRFEQKLVVFYRYDQPPPPHQTPERSFSLVLQFCIDFLLLSETVATDIRKRVLLVFCSKQGRAPMKKIFLCPLSNFRKEITAGGGVLNVWDHLIYTYIPFYYKPFVIHTY